MQTSDEKLVLLLRQGYNEAYGELVKRHQQKIYNLARKMLTSEEDARDAAQEIFVSAYKSIGHFQGQCQFSTWLYKIASNKCLDLLRKRARGGEIAQETLPPPLKEPVASSSLEPEEALLKKEKRMAVQRALSSLPDIYKIVMVLQHYQGLSYRDIAQTLDLPEKTVATRVYRAKLMLREILTGGEKNAMPSGKGESSCLPGQRIPLL